MSRFAIVSYSLLGYAVGLAGLTAFMLFVGGFAVPYRIDAEPTRALPLALAVNAGLLLLFGLQHSVMARKSFKSLFANYLPAAAERSTYVLLSGVVTLLLCFGWQPIAGVVWQVDFPLVSTLLTTLQWSGWALAVAATFMLSHQEMFGLQQAFAHATNRTASPPAFNDRWGYSLVRHPIQLGVLIGIWVTPFMSVSHLLLSIGLTTYIFIGLALEERDLVADFGDDYRDYQRRVRRLMPVPRWTADKQEALAR
ncbi:methyltransferase family protein [Aeoliella mucimassa]|uniref:Uncharacterized protein n=1 Tax=Aeoliella mucimassa TaxID=2527972 RepID=A0A518AV75_9BACT|nr:isoprenylcysteine carboxylmethyltransferase family protein [Aeoliella mucimassa]QDU58637.1 hypothetical protein Pan181_48760 [Aeoliella mucimassa]